MCTSPLTYFRTGIYYKNKKGEICERYLLGTSRNQTYDTYHLQDLTKKLECTKEEINTLKQEANKIKVTYKHLGSNVDDEGTVVDYMFSLTFSNINDDMYIRIDDYNEEWKEVKDNKITIDKIATGKYKFSVYSNNCQEKIGDINVKLPKFNSYSLDPLCAGINTDEFPLCSKYLEYQPSYETFVKKIEEYKKAQEVKTDDNKITKENTFTKILNQVLDFITKYQIYIISALTVILIILGILIIGSKKKKRGVLE